MVEFVPTSHIAADPPAFAAVHDPVVSYDGNPPPRGSLRYEGTFDTWVWFSAPPSWLGKRASAMGGDLIWRLWTPMQPAVTGPGVAIRGKSITLYTGVPGQVPTPNQWTGQSPKFYAQGWRINDPVNGPPASEGDMAEVLSDLRGVYFLASWRFGEPSVVYIDTVFMSGTPLPEGCVGDLNGDGNVTAADFVILAGNFGCTSTGSD